MHTPDSVFQEYEDRLKALRNELTEAHAATAVVLEKARRVARNIEFRCHSKDDVDFHSGCVQTRDSIVAAIDAISTDAAAALAEEKRKARLEEAEWWFHLWCPLPHGTGAREEAARNRFAQLRAEKGAKP